MTTFSRETKQCGVCGSSVECTILMSYSHFGSPDLDLRPPEMYRSTMHSWLQECPECSYVGGDVAESTDDAQAVIASTEYELLLSNDHFPELANRFLRFALLNANDDEMFGIAKLRAAWACDDVDITSLAQQCRIDAGDRLLRLQPFDDSEEGVSLATMLVDILRRAERYDESIALIHELQSMTAVPSNKVIREILEFQESLCSKEDTQCYTVIDVTNAG